MEKGIDTGEIVLQRSYPIPDQANSYQVINFLIDKYPILLFQAIQNYFNKNNKLIKQDISKASYFPIRKEKDNKIDWSSHTDYILNFIRALSSPLPNSYSFLGKTEIRIEKADKINNKKYSKEINGTIVDF